MRSLLFAFVLVMTTRAYAIPVLVEGPPKLDGFATMDPGSLDIQMLGAGEMVTTQLSITIHPLLVRPFMIDLDATGTGAGLLDNLSGVQINGGGGDMTFFDIKLTGDGAAHDFDIQFVDAEFGGVLGFIPVTILPDARPVPEPITAALIPLALSPIVMRRRRIV